MGDTQIHSLLVLLQGPLIHPSGQSFTASIRPQSSPNAAHAGGGGAGAGEEQGGQPKGRLTKSPSGSSLAQFAAQFSTASAHSGSGQNGRLRPGSVDLTRAGQAAAPPTSLFARLNTPMEGAEGGAAGGTGGESMLAIKLDRPLDRLVKKM